MTMKKFVIGCGRGGANQALTFMRACKAKDQHGQYTLVLLDTNRHSVEQGAALAQKEGFTFITLVLRAADGSAEGAAFQPANAQAAFELAQEQLSTLLELADVVYICCGFGKGTGQGICYPLADFLLRKEYIIVIVVISRPRRASPEEEKEHRKIFRLFHQRNLRIVVVDGQAMLTCPNLRHLNEPKAWAILDAAVVETLRGGLTPVLDESSQIDKSDLIAFLKGQGFLRPAFGQYVRPRSPAEPVGPELQIVSGQADPVAPPEAAKKKKKFNFIKVAQTAIWQAWEEATPDYYQEGKPVWAMVVYSGDWSTWEQQQLEAAIKESTVASLQIVSAVFNMEATELHFSVLIASNPDRLEKDVKPWTWRRRGEQTTEVTLTSAIAAGSGTAALLAAPEVGITATELLEGVFMRTTDPVRITFGNFMNSVKAHDNQVAYSLLAGSPQQLIKLCQEVIRDLNGDPYTFTLGLAEYRQNLATLGQPAVLAVLSPHFKADILTKAKEAERLFPPEINWKDITGTRHTLRTDAPISAYDELMQKALTDPQRQLLREMKWLRIILGSQFTQLVVSPAVVGAGNGTGHAAEAAKALSGDVGQRWWRRFVDL